MPDQPIQARLRTHALPLVIASLALLLALSGENGDLALRYDRVAIMNGEWWRLLTGNLVHLSWSHLWLNLAGLILVWLLFYTALTARAWWTVTVASAAAVGLGLLLFDPELEWYVGLSGMLHGLFAAGLVGRLRTGSKAEWVLAAVLIAKLAWEQWAGPSPGTAALAGGNVIVDAHLYGTIGGMLTGLVLVMRPRRQTP